MEETTQKKKFELPNRKIKVTPIIREGGWEGNAKANRFLFGDSVKSYTSPLNRHGFIISPLDEDETAYFERYLGMDLNPRIKQADKNFWATKRVDLKDETRILDLSNPDDYLDWKLLLLQKDYVAQGGENKFKKGTYEFCLEDVDFQNRQVSKKIEEKMKAYEVLTKLKTKGIQAQKDFLFVLFNTMKSTKTVPKHAEMSFVDSELIKVADEKPALIMMVESDKLFNEKVLLKRGVQDRAIVKDGSLHYTKDGDLMGKNQAEAIAWLRDVENQDKVLVIKHIIEESKG